MAQNRNLFRLTRFILLKMPGLFRFFAQFRSPQKRLLIIKTDAIGDYILFRNFIEVVNASDEHKEYRIDLLANELCRDIVLNYDDPFIGQSFFIKPDALYHKPLKTLKIGWQLFMQNYEIVLQPTYARTLINDGMAGMAAANQLFGFDGDTERINPKYKIKTDRFYSEKFVLPESLLFEFDRTRFFFETLLKRVVELYGPSIQFNQTEAKGIVIFPGAGVFKRSWEADKFVELIQLIRQQTDKPVYLVGGPSEISIGNHIGQQLSEGAVVNLINKTSLPQLIDLIGNADLIVSNETSAIHIAAATKTQAVCILGGGHFGRFAPYPEYMENKPICVYHKMECFNCNWNCIYITREDEPYPCIGHVSLDAVWQEVKSLL